MAANRHQHHLLRRGESDRAALKVAIERMHAGVLVGIAPEGTRSTTGGLLPGLPGAAFLAVHAGVPVLPVALLHTATAFGELKRLRRPHMVMKVGPAFTVPPLQPANRSAQLERITEEMTRAWPHKRQRRGAAFMPTTPACRNLSNGQKRTGWPSPKQIISCALHHAAHKPFQVLRLGVRQQYRMIRRLRQAPQYLQVTAGVLAGTKQNFLKQIFAHQSRA